MGKLLLLLVGRFTYWGHAQGTDLLATYRVATVGRDMLWRSLSRTRSRLSHHVLPRRKGRPWSPSPHDFGPEITARLRRLLEV
jgi:hypothetical protein